MKMFEAIKRSCLDVFECKECEFKQLMGSCPFTKSPFSWEESEVKFLGDIAERLIARNECLCNGEETDNVNHPSHYCQDGSMECIDEMVEVFGVRAVMNFCLCNVWKYRKRAMCKNGKEDLEKSDWYMKKYVELKEREADGRE